MMKYSIICPLCEDGALLGTTLEALFLLDCTDYEIIFAADPAAGAAIDVAKMLCQQYHRVPSQIVVNEMAYCTNPKLSNLYKGWLVALGQSIVMVDCNVLLTFDALQQLEARWTEQTGLVCSPPLGAQPANFWAEVECAYLNTFEAKWQLLADRLGYGFAQGKVMFCRKTQFEHLGGLLALDHTCEDAAATKLVRAGGRQVRLVTRPFTQPLGWRSLRQVWDRQLRWARLRRVTFPHWYAMEVLVTPLPLLLMIVCTHKITPLFFLGVFYASEMLLAKRAGWHLSRWTLPAMVVRDTMMLGVWIAGWFGNKIRWAGRELALQS